MKQNTIGETPILNNKQTGGNGLKIAVAIVSLVAICGIGFGVYGMMQSSQKDSQIADLRNQLEEASEDESDGGAETPNETVIVNPTSEETTKDYIYIGEWGLKFKIPDKLHQVEYQIRNSRDYDGVGASIVEGMGTSNLLVFGLLDEDINNDPEYTFNAYSPCTSASISRIPKGQIDYEPAFSIGEYDFVFGGWQYACTDEQGNPMPNQTGEIIRDALINPDNYSVI